MPPIFTELHALIRQIALGEDTEHFVGEWLQAEFPTYDELMVMKRMLDAFSKIQQQVYSERLLIIEVPCQYTCMDPGGNFTIIEPGVVGQLNALVGQGGWRMLDDSWSDGVNPSRAAANHDIYVQATSPKAFALIKLKF